MDKLDGQNDEQNDVQRECTTTIIGSNESIVKGCPVSTGIVLDIGVAQLKIKLKVKYFY